MQNTTSFDNACSYVRTEIKKIGEYVQNVKVNIHPIEGSKADIGEMIANVTLAFRHLEDAAMRMGKAIQAYEGEGKSIYDNKDTARAAGFTGVSNHPDVVNQDTVN